MPLSPLIVNPPAMPEIQTTWPTENPSAAHVPADRVRVLVPMLIAPVNDSFFGPAT